jgi:hypothetical protein
LLYAPGYNAEAKITSTGTLQTYTTPTLTNLSGKPITTMSIVNTGWYVQAEASGAQEVNVGNDYPVSAVVKNSSGTTIGTFTWSASSTGAVINGGQLVSDAITLSSSLQPTDTFTIVVTGTQSAGLFYAPKLGLTGVRTHTMSNGINPVSIYAFGDSVLTNNASYAATACAGVAPIVIQSVIGWKLTSANGALFTKRAALLSVLGATVGFGELCVNDITSQSSSTLIAAAGNIADQIKAAGLAAWWSTCTPSVTSSDSSFDLAHQTPGAGESVRLAFNASVRGLLSGKIARCVDMADAAESARDSGIWKYGSGFGPRLTAPLIRATATNVTTTTSMTLDAQSLTGSALGQNITGVAGVNAGVTRVISGTPSSVYNVTVAWPTIPAIGDTFDINVFTANATVDGLHPTAPYTSGPGQGGHYLLSDGFQAAVRAAQTASGYYTAPVFVRAEASRSGYTQTATYDFYYGGFLPSALNDSMSNLLGGELLILAVATPNAPITAPSGWSAILTQGSGTAGATLASGIQLFWKIHTLPAAGVPSKVNIAGITNHAMSVVYSFRFASQSSPIDVSAALSNSDGSTSIAWPSITTTAANDLIVAFGCDDTNSLTARLSSAANSALGALATLYDFGTNQGNGSGSFAVAGATSATGAIGGLTATIATGASVRQLASVGIRAGT